MKLRSALVFGAMAVSAPLVAAPLQPTGKWEVQYTASKCTAKRAFGDHLLLYEPAPLGLTTTYLIQAPGRARRARQYVTQLQIDDGPTSRVSSMVFPMKEKGRRAILTVLSAADAEQVRRGKRLRLWVGKPHVQPVGLPSDDLGPMAVDLAIGSTEALNKALDECMADLRRHWKMVDGNLPQPAKPPVAKLRGIFRSEDYPSDAMSASNSGRTTFLMMIDEKGALMDCVVEESSGVASLDAMGCQVIRERARFEPGYDASGKPMKSIIRQSVTWQIAG